MEFVSDYTKFCEQIDQCEDIDLIKEYQKQTTVKALRDEFWKQRKLYLSQSTPLEKQQALAKLQWLQHSFGCHIPLKRSVNRFLAPDGLYGIFISPLAFVGSDCVICPHVTIGPETAQDAENKGFPSIGNHVYIGPGAKIIGNLHIGDHSRIEANCCVTRDIPPYSVVRAGNPVVITPMAVDTAGYISPEAYIKKQFGTTFYDYMDHPDDPQLVAAKATPADLDEIWELYKQRTLWFRWKKQTQWGAYLDHHPKAEYAKKIEDGEYYTVRKAGQLIAGFSLSTDSENWNDSTANAWYLCRVVSLVGYKHIGNFIASESKRFAAEAGIDSLRLECLASNEQLNKIWEELGFRFIRESMGDYRCNLREFSLIAPPDDLIPPEETFTETAEQPNITDNDAQP